MRTLGAEISYGLHLHQGVGGRVRGISIAPGEVLVWPNEAMTIGGGKKQGL